MFGYTNPVSGKKINVRRFLIKPFYTKTFRIVDLSDECFVRQVWTANQIRNSGAQQGRETERG